LQAERASRGGTDSELRDFVRARVADSGVEVTELGVKDVILPGEIRELVTAPFLFEDGGTCQKSLPHEAGLARLLKTRLLRREGRGFRRALR